MTEGTATTRLARLYGQMTSLDAIMAALSSAGVEGDLLQARDIYTRDLDCQNLGAHRLLELEAELAAEHGAPGPHDLLLDIGCGLGGPGRFLVDRFGCSVVGIDVVPARIEIARALSDRTGLAGRISYRVADATDLPFEDGAFAQVWMLDVGIHVRDKRALFAGIARVLEPGGLLVMHDQTAPIPKAMLPVTRRAPYIAPSLPQLVRYVEGAGLRMQAWHDTTGRVTEFFLERRAASYDRPLEPSLDAPARRRHERMRALVDGYIETLANLDGRTGVMIARKR